VSTAGKLYSFGCSQYGQLGHGQLGDADSVQHTPQLVAALQNVRVSAVAAGLDHSLALSEGKVYSFGSNYHGQLGHVDSDAAPQSIPDVMVGLQGVRVHSVAGGGYTSLAVTTGGGVYVHGRGLGFDTTGGQPFRVRVHGVGPTEYHRHDHRVPLNCLLLSGQKVL
jgi:alpha-tubulin suppressor-like RCC1 family protein